MTNLDLWWSKTTQIIQTCKHTPNIIPQKADAQSSEIGSDSLVRFAGISTWFVLLGIQQSSPFLSKHCAPLLRCTMSYVYIFNTWSSIFANVDSILKSTNFVHRKLMWGTMQNDMFCIASKSRSTRIYKWWHEQAQHLSFEEYWEPALSLPILP